MPFPSAIEADVSPNMVTQHAVAPLNDYAGHRHRGLTDHQHGYRQSGPWTGARLAQQPGSLRIERSNTLLASIQQDQRPVSMLGWGIAVGGGALAWAVILITALH